MNVKINIPKANIKFSASYVTTSGHLPSKEVFKTSPPFKERLRPLPTLLCSCMSQLYQFFRPGSTCIRSSILFSFKLCFYADTPFAPIFLLHLKRFPIRSAIFSKFYPIQHNTSAFLFHVNLISITNRTRQAFIPNLHNLRLIYYRCPLSSSYDWNYHNRIINR